MPLGPVGSSPISSPELVNPTQASTLADVVNVDQPAKPWTAGNPERTSSVTHSPRTTSTTMGEFFEAWGLAPNLDVVRLAHEAGLSDVVPHYDSRGVQLAKTYFAQAQPSRDGTTLPLVLEGGAHTKALQAEAARAGFRTFVTGALSQPNDAFAKSTNPKLSPQAVITYGGWSYDAPALANDAPAMLVVSDYHWASYQALLPSADELKKRGITRVAAGFENEDLGARSIEEYERIGQPAQRMVAQRLRSYVEAGIKVDLFGLDEPRAVAADGSRPMQANVLRRLAWEQGMADPAAFDDPAIARAFLDQLEEKFRGYGLGFEAQIARIQRARTELPAQ